MTLIEKVRKEHPDEMNSFDRPVYCPTKYGYAGQPSYCGDIDYGDANKRCTECWNREISEVDDATMEAVIEDLKNPIMTDIPEEIIDKFNSVGNTYPVTSEDTRKILDSGNRRQFASGAVRDIQEGKGRMDLLPWGAIIEVSKHCENGAKKYGEHNVDKGIPTHSLCDSAARHLAKYLDGWTDEPHLLAAAWNLLWALQMELKHKECVDTPWMKKEDDTTNNPPICFL